MEAWWLNAGIETTAILVVFAMESVRFGLSSGLDTYIYTVYYYFPFIRNKLRGSY